MSKSIKARRATQPAMLLFAALLCSVAHASTDAGAFGGTSGAALLTANALRGESPGPLSPPLPEVNYLTLVLDEVSSPGATGPRAYPSAVRSNSLFAQSAAALRNPLSASLRGESDLALWNLVAVIHAQQSNRPFELVDTGVAALQVYPGGSVSAVPLPGAVWLFVMGVLGLAGTRVTGVGAVGRAAVGRRSTESAMGGAVPA